VEVTSRDPSILDQYRVAKSRPVEPLGHDDIAELTVTPPPDWDALLGAVRSVLPGKQSADDYHRAVEALLTALFYPSLDFPKREHRIHEGR
jgi:hypothetical protein